MTSRTSACTPPPRVSAGHVTCAAHVILSLGQGRSDTGVGRGRSSVRTLRVSTGGRTSRPGTRLHWSHPNRTHRRPGDVLDDTTCTGSDPRIGLTRHVTSVWTPFPTSFARHRTFSWLGSRSRVDDGLRQTWRLGFGSYVLRTDEVATVFGFFDVTDHRRTRVHPRDQSALAPTDREGSPDGEERTKKRRVKREKRGI